MFSKNYKVIPLHLERQIPFLERSQRSGREYQVPSCSRGVLGGQGSPAVNSSSAGSPGSLDESDSLSRVFLPEGPLPAPFAACWERAGSGEGMLLLHSLHLEDLFFAFLAFPSVSWMVFPCFFFPAARVVLLAPACTQLWQCLAGVCK